MSIEVLRVKKEPIYDRLSISETAKTVSNDSNPNLEESNKIGMQKSKPHIEIKVEEEEEKFSSTEEFTKNKRSIQKVSIAFLKETETETTTTTLEKATKNKRDKQHKSK